MCDIFKKTRRALVAGDEARGERGYKIRSEKTFEGLNL